MDSKESSFEYDWSLVTVDNIPKFIQQIKQSTKITLDEIVKIPKDKRTFKNTIQPMIDNVAKNKLLEVYCSFPLQVYSDIKINNASIKASKELSAFAIDMTMRKDVYTGIKEYNDMRPTLNENLSSAETKYMEKIMLDCKRNGLELEEKKLKRVKDIQQLLSDKCIEYSGNVDRVSTSFEFTKDELKGLPENMFKEREIPIEKTAPDKKRGWELPKFNPDNKKVTAKYKITLKYPDYFPVMKFVDNESVRKKLYCAMNSRCREENLKLLKEILALRQELAELMGYKNYSDYAVTVKMAKTTQKIFEFTDEVIQKMTPKFEKDFAAYLKIKKIQNKNAKSIELWDLLYYERMYSEQKYNMDLKNLREYFPMDTVTNGMLDVYQKLLSLIFVKNDKLSRWTPEIDLYEMYDSKTKELLGYFYLDLKPRDNKYGHACCSPLNNHSTSPKKTYPVVAMLCNFPKDGLIDFDDVETYFHEFGHAMHCILSKSPLAQLSSFSTPIDFIEMPSQMLEYWCYDKEIIQRMSCHIKTKQPIPESVVLTLKKISKLSKNYDRQLVYGRIDMLIHTTEYKSDLDKVYKDTIKKILKIDAPNGINVLSSFAHIVGGYEASYYGYIWSEVFASDMFHSRFEKEGLLNAKCGMDYRKCILEPGATKEAQDMIKDFLGRDPNSDAFFNEFKDS